VLDLGRTLALLFALLFSIRARSVVAVFALLVVGYVYYLEIVTAFGARDHGPMHVAYGSVTTTRTGQAQRVRIRAEK
jgi:hypothetical protein